VVMCVCDDMCLWWCFADDFLLSSMKWLHVSSVLFSVPQVVMPLMRCVDDRVVDRFSPNQEAFTSISVLWVTPLTEGEVKVAVRQKENRKIDFFLIFWWNSSEKLQCLSKFLKNITKRKPLSYSFKWATNRHSSYNDAEIAGDGATAVYLIRPGGRIRHTAVVPSPAISAS
jgi:hypothetical protein